ncbi:MAG: hypothetical protein H5T33_07955 [Candidatus Methanosuratus sp.]|nr:hypothetical protein [Candidatus Methanosuratincola sp.]
MIKVCCASLELLQSGALLLRPRLLVDVRSRFLAAMEDISDAVKLEKRLMTTSHSSAINVWGKYE